MADKMPGRAAQTASSISGAIYLAPANPQARLSALRVIAALLHATPAQYPGALLWSLLDHLEAQRSPPAPSPPNGECRMKNVECSQLLRPNGCRPTSDFWLPPPLPPRGLWGEPTPLRNS
jgi:hypothetical protein